MPQNVLATTTSQRLPPGTHTRVYLCSICVVDLTRLARCVSLAAVCSHMQRLLQAALLSFCIEFPFKISLNIKVFDVIIYDAFHSYLV